MASLWDAGRLLTRAAMTFLGGQQGDGAGMGAGACLGGKPLGYTLPLRPCLRSDVVGADRVDDF